ncbi:MAG TPA: alanine racemase [Candidatus Sulfotelmatobacter sp.]|nr:alanine racemase [Candidatus Sulfotelmatobacter sp.]
MATAEILSRVATRPTWAEVSLTTLRQNFRTVQKHVGANVTVCAVVKADAYGHGAVECSRALETEGARWLGVTSLDEAIPLREAGIRSSILLMTGFWRGEETEIIRMNLTPTVWELWQIESLDAAAAALGVARHPVHLKVDTGMGRLGIAVDQLPQVLGVLVAAKHLVLEGLSTHLASSEIMDAPSVAEQERSFETARRLLREAGVEPVFVHMANTNAIISRRETWVNMSRGNMKGNSMVRPGVALYGYYLPFQRAGREVSGGTLRLPVKPILTWKTRILSVRDFGPEQALGYGGTYVTKAPAHVAVLPVGYADGYNRQLSNRGRVIVREHYAPVVGSVSMDLTLVDVTGIPGVAVGDEVILLGASDGMSVDALEHARWANSTPYEILCNISKRVPRRYPS